MVDQWNRLTPPLVRGTQGEREGGEERGRERQTDRQTDKGRERLVDARSGHVSTSKHLLIDAAS